MRKKELRVFMLSLSEMLLGVVSQINAFMQRSEEESESESESEEEGEGEGEGEGEDAEDAGGRESSTTSDREEEHEESDADPELKQIREEVRSLGRRMGKNVGQVYSHRDINPDDTGDLYPFDRLPNDDTKYITVDEYFEKRMLSNDAKARRKPGGTPTGTPTGADQRALAARDPPDDGCDESLYELIGRVALIKMRRFSDASALFARRNKRSRDINMRLGGVSIRFEADFIHFYERFLHLLTRACTDTVPAIDHGLIESLVCEAKKNGRQGLLRMAIAALEENAPDPENMRDAANPNEIATAWSILDDAVRKEWDMRYAKRKAAIRAAADPNRASTSRQYVEQQQNSPIIIEESDDMEEDNKPESGEEAGEEVRKARQVVDSEREEGHDDSGSSPPPSRAISQDSDKEGGDFEREQQSPISQHRDDDEFDAKRRRLQ